MAAPGFNQGSAGNTALIKAARAKYDEFYTQLPDIENEMRHYKDHFFGKVVYCNCNDPRESSFFRYFWLNFKKLGLKRLITTCYKSQQRDLFSCHDTKRAIWLEYNGNPKGGREPDPEAIRTHWFEGDGDFRSAECIDLLKQVDIVVTNPPFSLFREYVAQLVDYGKMFLIIGSLNAISYKEIFPLIKGNKMWLGITPKGQDMLFDVTEDYAHYLVTTLHEGSAFSYVEGKIMSRLGNAAWFTNIDHEKRHEVLPLMPYSEERYPEYDNYHAINVGKVTTIPDYPGAMGVPVTFLDKYNPEQFEIIGIDRELTATSSRVGGQRFLLNGKEIYARIVIRQRRPTP